jgi:hypothetical protein
MRTVFSKKQIIAFDINIAFASKLRAVPNNTQKMIASYYKIDPFILTNINAICDAKSVYAYVLNESRAWPTMYECADEAGVSYAELSTNKRILDTERNNYSSFGRSLNQFIYQHKKSIRNV